MPRAPQHLLSLAPCPATRTPTAPAAWFVRLSAESLILSHTCILVLTCTHVCPPTSTQDPADDVDIQDEIEQAASDPHIAALQDSVISLRPKSKPELQQTLDNLDMSDDLKGIVLLYFELCLLRANNVAQHSMARVHEQYGCSLPVLKADINFKKAAIKQIFKVISGF